MAVVHTGKYRALHHWLLARSEDSLRVRFAEIEDVLGFELPPSSRNHLAHWYSYGGSAVGRAIRDAGWRARHVNLTAEVVELVRAEGADSVADVLEQRGVESRILELLLEVGQATSVAVCSEGATVLALGAAPDAYAAVYVRRSSLSVALEPSEARRLHDRTGLRLEVRNDTTSYLHVPSSALGDSMVRPQVQQAVLVAFERSFHGPRWERGLPERRRQQADVCPRCHMQMSVTGECDNCG